jgi:hypothetical protein
VRIATELMLGVVRLGELATAVTFAIVGGTGKFKKAQGTATVKPRRLPAGSRRQAIIGDRAPSPFLREELTQLAGERQDIHAKSSGPQRRSAAR